MFARVATAFAFGLFVVGAGTVPASSATAYMTLGDVARVCGAGVAPRTTLAIMQVESSGDPWAINDNDAGKSYAPATKEEAIALANALLARGHNIDAGVMQVNSANWAHYHASAAQIFEPCVNVAIGTDILLNSYFGTAHPASAASRRSLACRMTLQRAPSGELWCRSGGMVDLYGPGQVALYHAFQVYNSNHANGAPRYARAVWLAGVGLARNGW